MEKKTQQFKAEIAEMLDLVVNSLYSKKEIFLRELISNASDAIDRAKFLSLTDKALVADNPEWKIQIAADKGAKTLMISDNGIGMDAAELEQNLGTIASSGTKKFRVELLPDGLAKLKGLNQCGQLVVFFDAVVTGEADAGNGSPNVNTPTLTAKQTGGPAVTFTGNSPAVYTYRLKPDHLPPARRAEGREGR